MRQDARGGGDSERAQGTGQVSGGSGSRIQASADLAKTAGRSGENPGSSRFRGTRLQVAAGSLGLVTAGFVHPGERGQPGKEEEEEEAADRTERPQSRGAERPRQATRTRTAPSAAPRAAPRQSGSLLGLRLAVFPEALVTLQIGVASKSPRG